MSKPHQNCPGLPQQSTAVQCQASMGVVFNNNNGAKLIIPEMSKPSSHIGKPYFNNEHIDKRTQMNGDTHTHTHTHTQPKNKKTKTKSTHNQWT